MKERPEISMFAGAIELAKLLIPIAIATAIGCVAVGIGVDAYRDWMSSAEHPFERLQASANLVGAALGGFFGAGGACLVFWLERRAEQQRRRQQLKDLEIAIIHSNIDGCFGGWLSGFESVLQNYTPGLPGGLAYIAKICLGTPLSIDAEEWRQIRVDLHTQERVLRTINEARDLVLKKADKVINVPSKNLTDLLARAKNLRHAEREFLYSINWLLSSMSLLIRITPSYVDEVGMVQLIDRLRHKVMSILGTTTDVEGFEGDA